MVSDKDLKKIAVVYTLAESLWCCYYMVFGYRTKYGAVREYMIFFDVFFGTECLLNSLSGVVLFSGMQKFRLPRENLVENPPCHCITKFVDEPLQSLRFFIIWCVVAAALCFSGSCGLAYVMKYGTIPEEHKLDDKVLKKDEVLRSNSIFSSVVFFFIYAVFKSLVLIVLFKFYYHHLRKVKNGQPLYTPYDLGVHRQHRHMYTSAEKPFVSKFLIPSKHSAEPAPVGPRHPTSEGSFHAE